MGAIAGNKLRTLGESYLVVRDAFRSVDKFAKARKKGLVTNELQERLMLAVTEVNGCAMCSYYHTQMALESGMSMEEVDALLSGDGDEHIPTDELPAILFAQHYADSKGKVSKEAWERVVSIYGAEKSYAILSGIRMITFGNTYGIPFGSLKARFNKKSKTGVDARSSVYYEVAMMLSAALFMPVGIVHGMLMNMANAPCLEFDKNK